jgi:hypothetical protein
MAPEQNVVHLSQRLHKRVRFQSAAQSQMTELDAPNKMNVLEKLRCITHSGVGKLLQDMPLKLLFSTRREMVVYGTIFAGNIILIVRMKNHKLTIFYLGSPQDYLKIGSSNKPILLVDDSHVISGTEIRVKVLVTPDGYILFAWFGDLAAEEIPPRGLEIPLAA